MCQFVISPNSRHQFIHEKSAICTPSSIFFPESGMAVGISLENLPKMKLDSVNLLYYLYYTPLQSKWVFTRCSKQPGYFLGINKQQARNML